MALVLKDRVKETTTSTGTGTINLAGAATGFEGFVSAVGSGNSCYYTILDANGSAWEVGIGTVTDAATDTLSRDTILESSNSDNAISLTSGTHTVFLTYPADKSVYRNSNDQIVATASGIVFSDSTVQTTAPVDTNTTYTAGSGLQLDSTTFNAKTATTSASGITTLTNTIDSTQTKALTPKAVDDAGYGTMSNFILEDGDGTEVTISNAKEVKFVEGSGIDIDWTDVSDGTDGDPYDLTFTVDHDAASNFVANEHVDHTSVTLTAGSGLSGGGDISSNRTFNALTATTSASGITTLTNTINSDQDKALTPKAVNDAAYLTAHPSISAASSSDNSGRTYIQDLLLDSNGHVTGVATAAETVTDTNTTYTAGTGITLNGTEFDIDPTLISGRTEVTSADADYLLVWDADDSKLKKVDAGEFRGGGGGGDITSVVAGTGLSGGGTTGDVTIDVSGVDVSLLQGTVPVSKGGTNATSLADKAVLITQDTGTDTVSAAVMDANGELLIGGTSGPAVATLTQGSNITITNADGGITVAADDAFLVNDADDTTTGTITAGGLSTTGVVTLGESTYQHKFDRYKLTGVTSSNAVAITLGGSALSDHYAYRIRCYDEDSSNLNGSVFLVRENNANNGWDVKTVSIQKNSSGEFPEVFDDSGTVKVKTGTGSARDIIVYIEAIFINRNDVTGFIWGGDHIWSKVTNAAGTIDNIYTSGNVGVGTEVPVSAINLVGGSYVNEAVPASDTPTTEDATVTLDLSDGNYHNIVLGENVTKFEFTNAKRGQKFILRITQHGSSAKTVAWTNVDSDTGGTAATVRWAGNITPTMSTSTSHTDVYGFLCTNNAGSNFDGFIIGQDLPD